MPNAKLTSKSKIKVINNTIGSLSFMGTDGRKYFFARKDSFRMVDMEVLENLYNDYPSMITNGYIRFENKEVYEYLYVPEDIYKNVLSFNELVELIQEKDDEEIAKTLENAPSVIKENSARVAKELKIDSKKKVKSIKQATGFDIEEDEE